MNANEIQASPAERKPVKNLSVIVVASNGDCTILDYYRDGEIYSDGPYSLPVAQYLRPAAEVRQVSNATRGRYSFPTVDMPDRSGCR